MLVLLNGCTWVKFFPGLLFKENPVQGKLQAFSLSPCSDAARPAVSVRLHFLTCRCSKTLEEDSWLMAAQDAAFDFTLSCNTTI